MWWARAGKIMQFVAGLAVILDLVGPDRLRVAGKRMGTALGSVRNYLIGFRSSPERTLNGAIQTAGGAFLVSIGALMLFLLATNWAAMTKDLTTIAPVGLALVLLIFFLAIGSPESSAGARIPLLGLGWLAATSTLGLIAAILDKANPGHAVRWLGFLLFVMGFGLDLLGS
ncbi:hypothetical protein Acy02nite_92350 [Actinoplanes cyaneus]|uniref:Uncharacterized protein n=3 Tax=Actinoplanes cyaneus TaxID=52696 RepID=A0A919ISJ1_9ACTN|nr:hypothetical protein Acy02nite_92350 [Actinoplanes cyaneus]